MPAKTLCYWKMLHWLHYRIGTDQACDISSPQAPDPNGRIVKSVSGIVANDRRAN
jgi:hypothetical protein